MAALLVSLISGLVSLLRNIPPRKSINKNNTHARIVFHEVVAERLSPLSIVIARCNGVMKLVLRALAFVKWRNRHFFRRRTEGKILSRGTIM